MNKKACTNVQAFFYCSQQKTLIANINPHYGQVSHVVPAKTESGQR